MMVMNARRVLSFKLHVGSVGNIFIELLMVGMVVR